MKDEGEDITDEVNPMRQSVVRPFLEIGRRVTYGSMWRREPSIYAKEVSLRVSTELLLRVRKERKTTIIQRLDLLNSGIDSFRKTVIYIAASSIKAAFFPKPSCHQLLQSSLQALQNLIHRQQMLESSGIGTYLKLNLRLGNVLLTSTSTDDLCCLCDLRSDCLNVEILQGVTLDSVDAQFRVWLHNSESSGNYIAHKYYA